MASETEDDMVQLDGKRVVLTGASGDIGMAAAHKFAADGAALLLVGRQEAVLDGLRAEITEACPDTTIEIAIADVSREEDTASYVEAAKTKLGGIDVFINNAGYQGVVAPTGAYSVDAFDQVMATNVRGTWLGMRAVMPEMEDAGGSIIITSSMGGTKGFAGFSAYVTSKHANIGLMRTCAAEGAANGIRVNCVAPGPIESRMMAEIHSLAAPETPDVVKDQFLAGVPMGRYGDPSEVANVMAFLASDAASYVTGATYSVDGGVMI